MKPITPSSLSRRAFMKMALLAGGGILSACSPIAEALKNTMVPPPFPTSNPYEGLPSNQIKDTHLTPIPTNTNVPSAASTSESPQAPEPTRVEQKIKTVIFFIQENHSFDSLFAGYPGSNSKEFEVACTDSIKDKFFDFREPTTPFPCTYRKELVPNYWKLAEMFTLCDNFYTEVKGPSIPNYQMMTGAQLTTLVDPPTQMKCPEFCVDFPTLTDHLDKAGLTWADYGGMHASIKHLQSRPEVHFGDMGSFFEDVDAGRLQNVIWVNAALYGGDKVSGHPPGSMCEGENFAVNLINKVMFGPQWESTLLIWTEDDWGGFYDHVIPPWVESMLNGDPLRYGNRVPAIVVSPYSKQGYVSHTQYSFVSMLKTAEIIFGLQSLNFRDEEANSLLDCLDFNQQPIKPKWIDLRECGTK